MTDELSHISEEDVQEVYKMHKVKYFLKGGDETVSYQ